MARERKGYRLFKPFRYEPAATLPPDAVIDPYDRAAPDRERFARWKDVDGRRRKERIVRASKKRRTGGDGFEKVDAENAPDLLALPVSTWYVEFRDAREVVRRLPLFTIEKQSEKAAERIAQLVADVHTNGCMTDPDLIRWASALPEKMKAKLVEIGLLEAERVGVAKPLAEHLADFHATLLARGTTEKQATQT